MALPIIDGDDAIAAIEALALDHPHLSQHIRQLGNVLLRRAVGLRDGRDGASKTYDLSFINSQHSFACLTATPKKFDDATKGRLQVQVRYQGGVQLKVFELKSIPSAVHQGWHATQLAEDEDTAPLLEDLLIAFAD
ncbi:MAG: hypothetical protein OXQ29_04935 [Rhodospirillaceae bacterium]|nr:hypothetical protein [Rhodospirillaceae bacterium]